jgi:protein-S-isoprenylcysteine O-methyltransferase
MTVPTRAAGWFILVCWLAFLAVWIGMAARTKRTVEGGTGRVRMVWTIATGVAVIVWHRFLANGARGGNGDLWDYSPLLGVAAGVVMLGGLAFTLWARVILAGNWAASLAFKEGHELIVRGPYRFVRHPIYSGMLLMVVATAIYTGSIAWLIVLAGSFGFALMESRLEEALLARHFPAEYPAYRARVKGLIPFLL